MRSNFPDYNTTRQGFEDEIIYLRSRIGTLSIALANANLSFEFSKKDQKKQWNEFLKQSKIRTDEYIKWLNSDTLEVELCRMLRNIMDRVLNNPRIYPEIARDGIMELIHRHVVRDFVYDSLNKNVSHEIGA